MCVCMFVCVYVGGWAGVCVCGWVVGDPGWVSVVFKHELLVHVL